MLDRPLGLSWALRSGPTWWLLLARLIGASPSSLECREQDRGVNRARPCAMKELRSGEPLEGFDQSSDMV